MTYAVDLNLNIQTSLNIFNLTKRDNLKNGKWKKPIPAFKGASYEILQLFNKKFSIQTQNY
jgi:putative transposase